MFAIKQARKFIESHPNDPQVEILTGLILSLQSDEPFQLTSIYDLDAKCFELSLDIIKDWRIDRFYAKKQKLLDVVQRLTQSKSTEV